MGSFEKERRPDRPPAWRSSEGRMWEQHPREKKDGKDHLTGYEPRENEDRPREAARMGGSYGDVSIGVSRKKELTMVVSKRRSREGPAAREEERTLQGDRAKKLDLSRGDFRVNAHDPERSALAYRESHRKTPAFMLARFKEMMRTHRQDTLAEQVPFLDRREEREELRQLQSAREDLLAKKGGGDRETLRAIDRRRESLRQILTEKEGQERRLRLQLQKAQETSRRRAGETEQVRWQLQAAQEAEEPPPPPEGEDEDRGAAEALADALLARVLGEEAEETADQEAGIEEI